MRMLEIKKEITVGIITFIFGGGLTLVVENYINRPKPEISVKDISFNNSSKEIIKTHHTLIYYNDGLIKTQTNMQYDDLIKLEEELRTYLEASKALKINLSKWLDKYYLRNGIDSSLETISDFPVFNKAVHAKLFLNTIKEIDHIQIPLNSTILQKKPTIFHVGLNSQTNVLTVSTLYGEQTIEYFSPFNSREVYIYNNLIYSLRTNTVGNLQFFVQQCIATLNERLARYQELLASVENLLMENSRIKIKITIYNNGKDAVVIHPYFRLDVFNGKNIEEQYLLNTINYGRDDLKFLNDYFENIEKYFGEDDDIDTKEKLKLDSQFDSFFKSKKTFPHLSIPGGQNITVELESSPSLGLKGKEIRKWYESGALFCKVTGLTVEDKTVKSPEIIFNATVQDQVKSKLGL